MSMDNVYYNLVINGAIKREKVPYSAVLIETGLKDTVGLNQTNWVEWFPPRVEVVITAEQIGTAVRAARDWLLQQSDWTQAADSPLSDSVKAEWATYRQACRDMPATNSAITHPMDMVKPTKPS
jgi:hypothetical protein